MPLTDKQVAAYLALLEASTRLFNAVDRQLRDEAQISQTQFEILGRLHAAPEGIRMTDLAATVVSSLSGLTYQAEQLQRMGLIARERANGGDERSVIASLTGEGRELVARLAPFHIGLIQRHFTDLLSPEETEQLATSLARVAKSLKDAAPRKRTRR